MLPTLRPHQQRDLDALRTEVHAGRNPVLVAPCGYGKGTLISVIVHNATKLGHRVIFAVHGKSLVVDMSERVSRLGIKHGVLMGGERRERWHSVQVASIDTLHRMSHPPEAALIIIDECFSPGTLITMADQTQFPIETDPYPRLSLATPPGWGLSLEYRDRALIRNWLRLNYQMEKSFRCTADHRIFTGRGWIEAKPIGRGQNLRYRSHAHIVESHFDRARKCQ